MNAVFAALLLSLAPSGQDPAPEVPAPEPVPVDWTAGLTLVDLDAREAFLDGVLADARRSPERCEELTVWLATEAGGAGELAWTARLALRELQRPVPGDPFVGLFGGDHRIDVLFVGTGSEQMDLGFTLEGGQPVPMPEGAGQPESPDLLEAWVVGLAEQTNRFPLAGLPGLGDCTLELRMGADWASLRLLEAPELLPLEPGATDTDQAQAWTTRVREYQGRSLAEIVGKNPDLVGLLPFEVPGVVALSPGPRRDVLGVFARAVSAEQCSALGLEPGCGLEVVRVQPGTVAEVLGIAPGSVVLEVCGTVVRGQDGIKHAMGAAEEHHGADYLCVLWIDAFGRIHERTWKPGDGALVPERAAAPTPQPELPGGLKPVER